MPTHEIFIRVSQNDVVNRDLTIRVKSNGWRRLGVLTLSRGSIDWRATKTQEKRSLSWERFDALMQAQGRQPRTSTSA
jgi:hypothetical protein